MLSSLRYALCALLAHAVSESVSGGAACSSSFDCWLNGDCVSSSCVCDPAWIGAACNVLSELPSNQVWPPPDALPADTATLASSWGASIVRGDDGLYHAFVENTCRVRAIMHIAGSVIVHATATAVEGPYTFSDVALPQQAMTPHVVRDVDGSWLLAFQRQPNVTDLPQCTGGDGPTHGGSGPAAASNGPPSIARSASLYGPWVPQDFTISLPADAILPNPNPSLLPLGGGHGYMLAFTQMPRNFTNWGSERVSIAHADDWRSGVFMPVTAPGEADIGEDPFLWRDDRGYHVVFHRMNVPSSLNFTGVGGYGVSLDGKAWVFSTTPIYTTTVPWAPSGGAPLHFTRRERPEFLLDATSGRVSHLLTGCEEWVDHPGRPSLSVLTPLGPRPPSPSVRRYAVAVSDKSPQPILSLGLPRGRGHSPCNFTFNPAFLPAHPPGLNRSAVIVRVSGCPPEYGGTLDHLLYAYCEDDGSSCEDLQPHAFPFEHLAEDPRAFFSPRDGKFYLSYYANGTNQSTVFFRRSATPLVLDSWEPLAQALPWHRNGCVFYANGRYYVIFGETYAPAYSGHYIAGIGIASTKDFRVFDVLNATLMLPKPVGPEPEVCLEAATPPVQLSSGDWLHIFAAGTQGWGPWGPGINGAYTAGFLILDKDDPTIIVQRDVLHFFRPDLDYEIGTNPAWPVCRNNTLFVTSLVPIPGQRDAFKAWYGAADANVATAVVRVTQLSG